MFDLKPRSRTQLLDRWNRHTKLCLQCQKVCIHGISEHLPCMASQLTLHPELRPSTLPPPAQQHTAAEPHSSCSHAQTDQPPLQALKKVDQVLRVLQLAAAACIGLAVLRQQAALPLLGLAAAAVGLRVQLARLRQGFFTSTKPPGSQWHEKAPTPAVDWAE